MVATPNVIKSKSKIVMYALAGALSTLIFLTAIHVAAKMAIIIFIAIVTYLLLSLIHKMTTERHVSDKTDTSGNKALEDTISREDKHNNSKEGVVVPIENSEKN